MEQPLTDQQVPDIRIPVHEVLAKTTEAYQKLIADLVRQNAVVTAANDRLLTDLGEMTATSAAKQLAIDELTSELAQLEAAMRELATVEDEQPASDKQD